MAPSDYSAMAPSAKSVMAPSANSMIGKIQWNAHRSSAEYWGGATCYHEMVM